MASGCSASTPPPSEPSGCPPRVNESVSNPNSSSRKSASPHRRLPRTATTAAVTTTHAHTELDIVNPPPVATVATDAAQSTHSKRRERNLHHRVTAAQSRNVASDSMVRCAASEAAMLPVASTTCDLLVRTPGLPRSHRDPNVQEGRRSPPAPRSALSTPRSDALPGPRAPGVESACRVRLSSSSARWTAERFSVLSNWEMDLR